MGIIRTVQRLLLVLIIGPTCSRLLHFALPAQRRRQAVIALWPAPRAVTYRTATSRARCHVSHC